MNIQNEIKIEDDSLEEYPNVNKFNLRCGEIFLTSNGYQFNCTNCNDYFINFEYFADHVQKIHYITFNDTISNNFQQNQEIEEIPSSPHGFFDVGQQSENENISMDQANDQHYNDLVEQVKCDEKLTTFPDESDVEIIEIGECKYTLKKIPSTEDLQVSNSTNIIPTIANVQENYIPPLLPLTKVPLKTWKKFEFCCNKVFTNLDEYNTHLNNYHQDSPYICGECGKKFHRKDSLTEHMNSIHQVKLRYECKKCDLSFSTSESLQYHSRCHDNDDSFKCRICKENFGTRMLLASHFRIHTRPEPVKRSNRHCKCDICGSTLSRKDNFRRHLRNMHRLDNSAVEEIIRNLHSTPRYQLNHTM